MKAKCIYSGIAALTGVIVVASFSYGLFSGIEFFLEDLLFSAKPIDSEIVIVAIDEESLARVGQWPWPRQVFAQFLERISDVGPKVVGIDVMFAEPSRVGKEDDEQLTHRLKSAPYPVILPVEAGSLELGLRKRYEAPTFLRPLDGFAGAVGNERLGHVNIILDQDGIARSVPLSISVVGDPTHTETSAFGYEVARASRRQITVRGASGEGVRIVYAAPPGSVRRIPFWRVLDEDGASLLKEKIVLVGVTAADLHDEQLTPFSRGNAMPGVEIQAQIVNMVLSGERLIPLARLWMAALLLMAALSSGLFFVFLGRPSKALMGVCGMGILITVAVIIFFERGVVLNLVHLHMSWVMSSAAIVGYQYVSIEREKRMLRNLFSRYVSRDVMEEIMRDPSKVVLGGEEREVTVFFSDIRGFTSISEVTSPTKLVQILNLYFSTMSEEVLRHGGVLDKYIGDAIMAFWGAPVEDSHHADKALETALGMIGKLKDLNQELKRVGGPAINIGIGLYTGTAVVGNIGSLERFDYTVIGDTVNVASRLEGLTKEFKTRLVVGETTKRKITRDVEFKHLGSVNVKGRSEPLHVYTVAGTEWG